VSSGRGIFDKASTAVKHFTHSLLGRDQSEIDKNKRRKQEQKKRSVEHENAEHAKKMREVRHKNCDPFILRGDSNSFHPAGHSTCMLQLCFRPKILLDFFVTAL
jgi:hypothetical protein